MQYTLKSTLVKVISQKVNKRVEFPKMYIEIFKNGMVSKLIVWMKRKCFNAFFIFIF